MLREQLGKRSGVYRFSVEELLIETAGGKLPLLSAATLNGIRRLVAEDLDTASAGLSLRGKETSPRYAAEMPHRDNLLPASPRHSRPDRESPSFAGLTGESPTLLRSKYCIRYELGLCPKHQGAKPPKELYLVNNGRRLALHFDCAACEMTVTA
jgi:putative protease